MAVLQTLQLHNLPLLKFTTDWCSSTNLPRFDDTNYATGGDLPSLFAVLAVSLTLLPPSPSPSYFSSNFHELLSLRRRNLPFMRSVSVLLLGEKKFPLCSALNFEKRSDLITLGEGLFPTRLRALRRPLSGILLLCPVREWEGKILIRSCEVGSFVTLLNACALVRPFFRVGIVRSP